MRPRLRTSHMDASSRRVTYCCSDPKLHLVPSTCTVTWRLLSPRTQNDLLVHTYQAGGGKWNRITILTGARQHLYRYCSGEEDKHLVVQKPQMRGKKITISCWSVTSTFSIGAHTVLLLCTLAAFLKSWANIKKRHTSKTVFPSKTRGQRYWTQPGIRR